MLKISTLANTAIGELTDCFNESYSDYIVPLHLTETQMMDNIKGRRIKLELSVGAFDEGKMTGFILIGIDEMEDELVAYNGGTGVIPGYRWQGLTRELYAVLLPMLLAQGVKKNILEVITGNAKAIHVYQSLGYQVRRELWCYKGIVKEIEMISDYKMSRLTKYDWNILTSFWDWTPSWQHDRSAVENLFEKSVSLGIFDGEILIGYLIYHADTKRVQQFAVDENYRNRGVGKALFTYIAKNYSPELSVINVDGKANASLFFLESLGLNCFIKQYEMELMVG